MRRRRLRALRLRSALVSLPRLVSLTGIAVLCACSGPDDVVAHALELGAHDAGSDARVSTPDPCEGVVPRVGPRIPTFAYFFADDCALDFSEVAQGQSPAVTIGELTLLAGAPITPPEGVPAANACGLVPNGWYFDDFRMPTAVYLCENTCRALREALLQQVQSDLCTPVPSDQSDQDAGMEAASP